MSNIKKDSVIKVRIPTKLKNKVKTLALTYSDGNISMWVRYCLENYSPKFLIRNRPNKKKLLGL